jgi:copper chaperone NosL
MGGERRFSWAPWLLVLVLLAGAGAFAWSLMRAQSLPTGPVPVAWDHTRCSRCGMLIGNPSFAAQLQTKGGEVLDFDDPGCLLLYVLEKQPDVHAIYFHHQFDDRWLPREDAAFYPASPTPMNYGLGALSKQEGEGLSFDAATEQARVRERARERH